LILKVIDVFGQQLSFRSAWAVMMPVFVFGQQLFFWGGSARLQFCLSSIDANICEL